MPAGRSDVRNACAELGAGIARLSRRFRFSRECGQSVAERAYRARLQTYANDGRPDVDPALVEWLDSRMATLKVAAVFELPASASSREIHVPALRGKCLGDGWRQAARRRRAAMAPSDDEPGICSRTRWRTCLRSTRELASVARYFVDNGRNRDYEDIQRELDESFRMTLRLDTIHVQQELEADYIGLILGAEAGMTRTRCAARCASWGPPRHGVVDASGRSGAHAGCGGTSCGAPESRERRPAPLRSHSTSRRRQARLLPARYHAPLLQNQTAAKTSACRSNPRRRDERGRHPRSVRHGNRTQARLDPSANKALRTHPTLAALAVGKPSRDS
jgi:hypothetical protein